MKHAHRLVFLLFCLRAAVVVATEAGGGSLTSSSPFLSATVPGVAVAPAEEIELHGILFAGGRTYFCIWDAGRKKLIDWVTVDEPGHDFVVKSYLAAEDAITVELHGRTLRLALSKSKVATAGDIAAAMPTPSPAESLPPPVAVPAPSKSLSPEENRARIQALFDRARRSAQVQQLAVEQEVARRQATRTNTTESSPVSPP